MSLTTGRICDDCKQFVPEWATDHERICPSRPPSRTSLMGSVAGSMSGIDERIARIEDKLDWIIAHLQPSAQGPAA